jgi:hypothetical protein
VTVAKLAGALVLGVLLERLKEKFGAYEIVAHWTQGEFHHDVVLRVRDTDELPGSVLVVSTNCNGGIKEILCLNEVPDRGALWHARCPKSPEFSGDMPEVLARATTIHWFDPCELLGPDARSELRQEHRRRQLGGGWEKR